MNAFKVLVAYLALLTVCLTALGLCVLWPHKSVTREQTVITDHEDSTTGKAQKESRLAKPDWPGDTLQRCRNRLDAGEKGAMIYYFDPRCQVRDTSLVLAGGGGE